jgi:hypothetical protein
MKKDSKVPAKNSPNDLGAYVATEVARGEQDYKNVRDRALSLVTTSGGLVAVISGLLAIAVGTTQSVVPTNAKWTVAISLGSFVVSTIFALFINLPQTVISSDEDALGTYVECHWDDSGWDKEVASIEVDYLKSLRRDNAHTSKILKASISFQILGIAFIGASAYFILLHAS